MKIKVRSEKETSDEKAENIQAERNNAHAESEEDGWTVLQKEASQKHLYPTLPETENSNSNSGWLTKLLEAKAGDVGQTMKVLKIQK